MRSTSSNTGKAASSVQPSRLKTKDKPRSTDTLDSQAKSRETRARNPLSSQGKKRADRPGEVIFEAGGNVLEGDGEGGFPLADQEVSAVAVLRQLMGSSQALPGERIAAAKAVAAIEMRGGSGSQAPVSRMTRDELCAEIARVRSLLGGK